MSHKKKTDASVFSTGKTAAANFAKEKTKRQRMPADHLDYDVRRAEELGYGPHYGHYKADHPETLAEFEELTGIKKVDIMAPGKTEKTCPTCGQKFIVNNTNFCKRYCCDDCRRNAEYQRTRAMTPELYCAWCGKEIPLRTHRRTYCCKDCYYAAKSYRDDKKKEEQNNGNE